MGLVPPVLQRGRAEVGVRQWEYIRIAEVPVHGIDYSTPLKRFLARDACSNATVISQGDCRARMLLGASMRVAISASPVEPVHTTVHLAPIV